MSVGITDHERRDGGRLAQRVDRRKPAQPCGQPAGGERVAGPDRVGHGDGARADPHGAARRGGRRTARAVGHHDRGGTALQEARGIGRQLQKVEFLVADEQGVHAAGESRVRPPPLGRAGKAQPHVRVEGYVYAGARGDGYQVVDEVLGRR